MCGFLERVESDVWVLEMMGCVWILESKDMWILESVEREDVWILVSGVCVWIFGEGR